MQLPYEVVAGQNIVDWLDAAHGPWDKGRRVAAVIFGYADGSGSHRDSKRGPAKVRCIGAMLGDKDVWLDFDARWNAVLDKPEWPSRLKEFHTVDCVHQEGEFKDWPYPYRLAVFGDLVKVIMDSPKIVPIGSSNIIEHFQKLPPDDIELLKAEHLGTPLEIVCQYLFQRIITLTRQCFGDSEQVALTFDNEHGTDALEYHRLYDEYAARYPLADTLACKSLNFVSGVNVTPLQAADLLSYTTYQWEMETYYPRDAEPYFDVLPTFKRMVQAIEPDGGRYNLEGLQRLVANIKAGKKMQPHQHLLEKKAVCSYANCAKSFVISYDTRQPAPVGIIQRPCPHCGRLNDVSWP